MWSARVSAARKAVSGNWFMFENHLLLTAGRDEAKDTVSTHEQVQRAPPHFLRTIRMLITSSHSNSADTFHKVLQRATRKTGDIARQLCKSTRTRAAPRLADGFGSGGGGSSRAPSTRACCSFLKPICEPSACQPSAMPDPFLFSSQAAPDPRCPRRQRGRGSRRRRG